MSFSPLFSRSLCHLTTISFFPRPNASKDARATQVEKGRKGKKGGKKDDIESSSEEGEDEEKVSNRDLLTEDEKRQNHIASEKKRRNNIRVAFDTMTELVPSLNGTSFSKATILNKANEYIFYLKEKNQQLDLENQQLMERLQARFASPPHFSPFNAFF